MVLTTTTVRVRGLWALLLAAGLALQTGAQDNRTPGEVLKSALKAQELGRNDAAINSFFLYLEQVEESRAPRVVIIAQDCRYRLATLLTAEKRYEEATPVLCDYLKGPYLTQPRQAMRLLAKCYYETELWHECADIAIRALEYDKYPSPLPQARGDSDFSAHHRPDRQQEEAYTPEEVDELEKMLDKALPFAVESETPEIARGLEAKHDFPVKAAKVSPGLLDLLGDTFSDSSQEPVSPHTFADKTIGIYFAAQWQSQCLFFTPKLVKFHQQMTGAGEPFEIVFVSVDRNQTAMYDFMKKTEMPWPVLPYKGGRREALANTFGIKSIPALVIVRSDGKLITTDGQKDVLSKGSAAFDEWSKK